MTVEDLGEFGLIDRIIARLGAAAARDVAVPPGDDAAAWAVDPGLAVATVDTLAEGTHWRRDTMSFADVGWRAVATSVSDLAAMGAEPRFLLISVELGPTVGLDDVDAFADGVAAACSRYDVRVVGGNVVGTAATSVHTTAFGTAVAAEDGSPALLRRDSALHPSAVALLGGPNARELALSGGEDYELALTAPAATLGPLTDGEAPPTTIGRVVAEHTGEVVVLDGDGRRLVQPRGGWDQLRSARG